MDENIPIIDPEASAAAGYSVPEAGTSMDFSSLFGSMFGMSGENSSNMQELMNQYMQFVRDNTDYNNAWSAEQAQKQMDFQALSQQLAQQYNSEEAAKNRNWQEYMSSSAHQREIADLKAAGLNPVLSAMGGNGAAVTSGATASSQAMSGAKGDGDQSMNGAITSILGSALNVMTSLAQKSIDAQTSLAVAEKYTEMERIIEGMREAYGRWEHENYPSSMYEAISALIGVLSGSNQSNPIGDILFGEGSVIGSFGYGTTSGLDVTSKSGSSGGVIDAIIGKATRLGVPDKDTNFLKRISQDGFEDYNGKAAVIAHIWDWINHPKLWNSISLKDYLRQFESRQGQPGSGSSWHSGEGFSGSSGKF